jgi:hypothetical protein
MITTLIFSWNASDRAAVSSNASSERTCHTYCHFVINKETFFHQSHYCWFWRNWNIGKPSSKFPMTFFVGFLPYVGFHNIFCIILYCIFLNKNNLPHNEKCWCTVLIFANHRREFIHITYSIQNLAVCMDYMTVLRWCNAISVCTAVNTGGLRLVPWPFRLCLDYAFNWIPCRWMHPDDWGSSQNVCTCLCYTSSVIFIMLVLF